MDDHQDAAGVRLRGKSGYMPVRSAVPWARVWVASGCSGVVLREGELALIDNGEIIPSRQKQSGLEPRATWLSGVCLDLTPLVKREEPCGYACLSYKMHLANGGSKINNSHNDDGTTN
ncbi:unnamed protein product [Lampetra planeri]